MGGLGWTPLILPGRGHCIRLPTGTPPMPLGQKMNDWPHAPVCLVTYVMHYRGNPDSFSLPSYLIGLAITLKMWPKLVKNHHWGGTMGG